MSFFKSYRRKTEPGVRAIELKAQYIWTLLPALGYSSFKYLRLNMTKDQITITDSNDKNFVEGDFFIENENIFMPREKFLSTFEEE